MSKTIKDLLNELPEIYQDVLVDGATAVKGRRNCPQRWDLIKEHIGPHDVVLDLGSSLGYFGLKIATEYPDSLVISFEGDPKMCRIQAELFRRAGIYNVVVCNKRLTIGDLDFWQQHVDCFDTVLALSVLHHFPAGNVKTVFEMLQSLSPRIIGECPAKEEVEACGGDAKRSAQKLVTPELDVIGTAPSHLGNYQRKIWIDQAGKSRHPLIIRNNLDAYFGVSHKGRHQFRLKWNKYWTLNGRRIIPGINAHNLGTFGVVWPPQTWWQAQAIGAFKGLDFKSDVKTWNLLVTSTGLKAIDFMTRFPKGDQAEFRESDYKKLWP